MYRWEVGNRALCGSVTPVVCDDRVSVAVFLLEIHMTDLHEVLDLATSVDTPEAVLRFHIRFRTGNSKTDQKDLHPRHTRQD